MDEQGKRREESFQGLAEARKTELEERALTQKTLQKMGEIAQVMVVIFAVVCLSSGGLLSIKAEWAREIDRDSLIIPGTDAQYYATAILNLVTGILYAITAIGLYAMTAWGKKLNIISVTVSVVGTLIVEMLEVDRGNALESVADVLFWSALPIIQLTLMLVATSGKTPPPLPESHAGESRES